MLDSSTNSGATGTGTYDPASNTIVATPNSPAKQVGVVSSVQGANTIQQKAATLATLTPQQQADQVKGSVNQSEKNNANTPTESPTTKVTLLNPTTGQSQQFDNAEINKDAITSLMKSGYQPSDVSSTGTVPNWLTSSVTGVSTPVSAEDKAKADVADASKTISDLSSQLSKYTISDATLSATVQSITDAFNTRIETMKQLNASRTSAMNTTGIRLGSQYSGGSGGNFGSIVTAEESAGVQRIGSLEAQKQAAIQAAKTAAMTQNWSVFSKQVDLAQTAYNNKATALKNLQDRVDAQNKVMQDQVQKNNDNLVAAKKDAYDTALKNGAPQSVLDAIGVAKTQTDAYGAASGYGVTPSSQIVDFTNADGTHSKALVDTTPGSTNAGKVLKWIGGGSADTSGSGGTGGTQSALTDNYKDFLTGRTVDQVGAFNKLSSLDKSTISQLINGDVLLSDIIKTRGIQGTAATEALLQKAKSIDPTFSVNMNKIRYDFMKDWQSTTSGVGQTKIAINTALGHLADVSTMAKELTPANLQFINKTKNWIDQQTGDPAITNLQFGLTQLAAEIATAYKGGAPSQAEIDGEKAVLGTQFTRSQFQGVFNTAAQFLSSKITASRYSYKSTMGKDYNQSIIDPEKRQALVDAGIDPNSIVKEHIPGTGSTSIGDKITQALTVTNPQTKQPYTATEVLNHLSNSDQTYGTKIQQARAQKIPDDEIINYLKGL